MEEIPVFTKRPEEVDVTAAPTISPLKVVAVTIPLGVKIPLSIKVTTPILALVAVAIPITLIPEGFNSTAEFAASRVDETFTFPRTSRVAVGIALAIPTEEIPT